MISMNDNLLSVDGFLVKQFLESGTLPKHFKVWALVHFIEYGASMNRLIALIETEEAYHEFMSSIGVASYKKLRLPVVCMGIYDGPNCGLVFYNDINIIESLGKELEQKFEKELEAKLKSKSNTGHWVEILEGDEEGFCVDLNKLAHVGNVGSRGDHYNNGFMLIYPGTEHIYQGFSTKEKAIKARNELTQLFKER